MVLGNKEFLLTVLLCQQRVLERDCEARVEKAIFPSCLLSVLIRVTPRTFPQSGGSSLLLQKQQNNFNLLFATVPEPTSLHSFRNTSTSLSASTL